MAGASLLALLDDIATLLDDIAVMSKVAAKKTAAVVGDDLAVNANQVSGVRAERELPVVWAVAKGSLLNKVIIVPVILLLSALAPWSITPMLVVGGLYLCFEGAEKVWHFLSHRGHDNHRQRDILADVSITDLVAYERDKIRGAIRTDFILSLEIIVIALGAFPEAALSKQAIALSVIGIGMTVVVYGVVAVIVKLDDVGLAWTARQGGWLRAGQALLWLAPRLLRVLTIVGTVAMFLVGGSIVVHAVAHYLPMLPLLTWHGLLGLIRDLVVGLILGSVLVGIVTLLAQLRPDRVKEEY